MKPGTTIELTDEERLDLVESLEKISDNQLYFIIRHPWRYSSAVVQECELLVEGVMGCGAASFIFDLTDEELYVGGT